VQIGREWITSYCMSVSQLSSCYDFCIHNSSPQRSSASVHVDGVEIESVHKVRM
jgi:hypothetical protein